MEMNPDQWFDHDKKILLRQSAGELAKFVGAPADNIILIENVTNGVNSVMRSMDLQEGDEVLCLSLAYPGVHNTLRYICYNLQTMVELVEVNIKVPLVDFQSLVNMVLDAITDTTRLAVFDHISSPHGLLLPVEALVQACHQRGVPVLIDGAHAPGQLPLNLTALNADFYVGNCYKWLFGPKGCAFMYVKSEHHHMVRPVVTSRHPAEADFIQDFMELGKRESVVLYIYVCMRGR
jgi:isopenicillin-N epimerase